MAEAAREEEVEYESDPEEAKLSLKMRRREASDDEEGEGGCGDRENGEGTDGTKTRRRIVDSDVESDGQGAPADYEDEDYAEEEEEEEDDELIENDDYVEDLEVEYEDGRGGEIGGVAAGAAKGELLVPLGGKESLEDRVGPKPRGGLDGSNDVPNFDGISKGNEQRDEEVEGQDEEKEENEPYAVPTAGAFYMHDDRFRENSGGRHRRTFGGKKLWESKDDKKWGHDKFEELTLQDRHFDEGRRNSRGRYRARGWNRGAERGGYVRGNRPRSYNSGKSQSKNNIQINAPKSVRGRGPRRYQPSFKNNDEVPAMPSQQSGKVAEKPSNSSYGRVSAPNSNVESEAAPAKKHVFASSLSSASPPFYPSTSASKEIPISQKRDVQPVVSNRWIHPFAVDQNISTAQSTAVRRGKTVVDSVGMDKLYIDDSVSSVSGKPSTPLQFPSGSSSVSSSQSLQPQINYQSTGPNNQVNRISPCTQLNAAKKNPGQSRGHLSLQASSQQFTQNPGSGSQASSPPKAALRKSSFEPVEKEPPSELSKSKAASVVKGKGGIQGNGRGSFLYGGAQVMGASGTLGGGHGDQNFPAFLPVMQFGGQHPGGIGVPAVGMAFPGYVGQPQLGLGNSEMTWLPVLAGAAGALGATYCSPYMSVDGSSGQASSVAAASIKENTTADKHSNEWNPAQRSEVANDDFGQRQKNSRRYTEMKFDQ